MTGAHLALLRTWADKVCRRRGHAKGIGNVRRRKVVHLVVQNNTVGRQDLAAPVQIDCARHRHGISIRADDYVVRRERPSVEGAA